MLLVTFQQSSILYVLHAQLVKMWFYSKTSMVQAEKYPVQKFTRSSFSNVNLFFFFFFSDLNSFTVLDCWSDKESSICHLGLWKIVTACQKMMDIISSSSPIVLFINCTGGMWQICVVSHEKPFLKLTAIIETSKSVSSTSQLLLRHIKLNRTVCLPHL